MYKYVHCWTVNSKGFNMTGTLDTIATLKLLARANDLAKARRVALNRIMYEVRILHSIDAIKSTIETLLVELATVESNIVNNSIFEQSTMPTDADYLAALGPCNK